MHPSAEELRRTRERSRQALNYISKYCSFEGWGAGKVLAVAPWEALQKRPVMYPCKWLEQLDLRARWKILFKALVERRAKDQFA